MQLEKVANSFVYQPRVLSSMNLIHQKINFSLFLHSFIQLITQTTVFFLRTALVIHEYSQRIVSAVYVVFWRLINPPSFDPTHHSFREMVDQLKNQVPLLQEHIDKLDQRFRQDHLISRDIQKFKKLNNEVSQVYCQLDYYVKVLERRRNPFPIQSKLTLVRNAFQNLDHQIDLYCLRKGEGILEQFEKAVSVFEKGGYRLPKEIRIELSTTWKSIQDVFKVRMRPHYQTDEAKKISYTMERIKSKMLTIQQQFLQTGQVQMALPLSLKNIGNSCYLDSVLQAFLCINQVREQFNKRLVRDPSRPDDYLKELAIQQEILQFIDVHEGNEIRTGGLTQMEFYLFLLGGPSLHRLRDAIFRSSFNLDLSDMKELTEQQDSRCVIELFIEHFLQDYKFKWRGFAKTKAFPGLEFPNGGLEGNDGEESYLSIPLRSLKENQTLDVLIRSFIGKHIERENDPRFQRFFNPKNGVVIKGKEKEAEKVMDGDPIKVEEFCEWYKFKKLPPVLTIQFKRFDFQLRKDNRPVLLPKNGILDLTPFYDPYPEEPKKAIYKIRSMIRHSGNSLKCGHFVADVEINGKYFYCNDSDPKCFKKITAKQFFSRKDPYFLILERLYDGKRENE